MDSTTALLFASVMALFNGGVLGLMHRSLQPETRPSAIDWRIGTLLFAGAGILMALRAEFPAAFILPIAYGMAFVGASLYWRANRRFCGLTDHSWIFVPATIGVILMYLLTAVWAQSAIRVALAASILAGLFLSGGRTLRASHRIDVVLSRRVLIVLFYGVGALMMLRAFFFAAAATIPSLRAGIGPVDVAASVLLPTLPVVGTTAFLLMCLERSGLALQRAADTDDLTGLPNRRRITRAGEKRFASSQISGQGFAVAVIDVDHFKQINDRYGHGVGDIALRHIADVLRACCREPHLLGRQGGEEFVALLEIANRDEALSYAERLRTAVDAAPLATHHGSHPISASVGVGMRQDGDGDYDAVLRRADAALYAAKANGRNRVEFRE